MRRKRELRDRREKILYLVGEKDEVDIKKDSKGGGRGKR